MSTPRASLTEEQLQEELMRLDAYRAQFNALLQQHQLLAESRAEHSRARESLEGFDRVGAGPELLLPLGAETFVRGTVSPDGRVLIGIGSGLVTEMERAKAEELLAQRILQIEKATGELESNLRTLEERISVLSARLESMTRRPSGPEGGEARTADVGRD